MKIFEDLVDYILENIKPYPGNIDVAENTSYLVGLIKRFAKENNNGWVPVRERFPNASEINKDNGRFLITQEMYYPKKPKGIVVEGYYDGVKNGFTRSWRDKIILLDVVAWMPLPEEYMEGEE